MNKKVNIIANEKCWIESTAVTQLEKISVLPGVINTVGLPDLHAGKHPVGAVITTENIFYPHLIGNDIGCGMGLFETNCALKKFKTDRFITRLNHIRELAELHTENPFGEESPLMKLGTIGGGNHFAEFQKVDKVYNQEAFQQLNLDRQKLLLLIHSGSRDYGQRIYSEFADPEGLSADSAEAYAYLKKHTHALLWANRNRKITAEKLMNYLGYASEVKTVIDCHHNFLEKAAGTYIHRKGAVSTQNGLVVIPGSRGSFTYIVNPSMNTELSSHSLSHGAGRKWARSLCKSRIRDKYNNDTIRRTKLGSHTVCHDTDLLFQESPEAYKNIEQVITSLTDHGLCEVVAVLSPLITYKG